MKKLVIVDDDPDDIQLFKDAVSKSGVTAESYSANNGKDLLAQLESKNIVEPDIIFLDINMPEMNGWECLIKLKAHPKFHHIPVLMYSTSSSMRDAAKAVELGAIGLYKKPSSYAQLKEFMHQLIANEVINQYSLSELIAAGRKPGLFV